MEDKERCLYHEDNKRLRKEKGFITGGCAVRWDIPCGGKPDLVPAPYQCSGFYVTDEDANKVNSALKTFHAE